MMMSGETETKDADVFERDTKLNIHQRINAVMDEINYIKKDKEIKTAKGAHMYNVTGHDAVTKLVHPFFVKYGINLIPSFCEMTSEMVMVKQYEKIQEVHRTRVDAIFKWVNVDDPKDFFEQSWSGYGCDNADKGPGKAISYAQRYVVLKTLHIETGEKDLEEDEPEVIPHSEAVKERVEQETPNKTDGKKVSKAQAGLIFHKFQESGFGKEDMEVYCQTHYGVKSNYDLPMVAVKEILKKFDEGDLRPIGDSGDIPF
jgi:hypothetical protein